MLSHLIRLCHETSWPQCGLAGHCHCVTAVRSWSCPWASDWPCRSKAYADCFVHNCPCSAACRIRMQGLHQQVENTSTVNPSSSLPQRVQCFPTRHHCMLCTCRMALMPMSADMYGAIAACRTMQVKKPAACLCAKAYDRTVQWLRSLLHGCISPPRITMCAHSLDHCSSQASCSPGASTGVLITHSNQPTV